MFEKPLQPSLVILLVLVLGDRAVAQAPIPRPQPHPNPHGYYYQVDAPRIAGLLDATPDADDPLSSMGPSGLQPPKPGGVMSNAEAAKANEPDPHEALWTEDCYPSAESCRACHPGHYEQWRVSSHAYACVSPMFNCFDQAMQNLTVGTVGSFCQRCHSPIATQLKLPRTTSMLDAPPVVREGITCIACHRVNEQYGRSHGDRRIEPGDINDPVYGGSNGQGLADAIARASELKLKLDDSKTPGQRIHRQSFFFEPLTQSDVCVSCHQVAVHPGIWLEVVHAQYRSGPAAAKGITCQQCHMGAVPGKADGYDWGYVAYLNDKPYGEPRKISNHTFWGPNYSIAHPGIFPHNPKAKKYSPREWLAFDYRAGWGTDAFERTVPPHATFPTPWDNADERRSARKIVDENLAAAQKKRESAIVTYQAGVEVGKPVFITPPRVGRPLKVAFKVSNISEGHNMPTGSLGAQPQLWLNVALVNPRGQRVWESGYLDTNGDLVDLHSIDVHEGRVARDANLFNLQTKFLVNNIRGTDREQPAPLNFSLDQLVFLRPGAVPVSVLNHPPLIRMEAHSIPPLDHRMAKYNIPAGALCEPGTYRISVRMRSRVEPPYFMRLIESSPEMIRRMNEGILDIVPASYTFTVQ